MSEQTTGVAIVGAGGWGKNHVRNYAAMPEAELLYVCDRSPDVRLRIEAAYPDVTVADNVRRALDDDRLPDTGVAGRIAPSGVSGR